MVGKSSAGMAGVGFSSGVSANSTAAETPPPHTHGGSDCDAGKLDAILILIILILAGAWT